MDASCAAAVSEWFVFRETLTPVPGDKEPELFAPHRTAPPRAVSSHSLETKRKQNHLPNVIVAGSVSAIW